MSYEIKRTEARAVFKQLLGQANHFLITILIGLQAVRDGNATPDQEFSTSWNPRNVKDSADRSRMFALDLALVRAVDALDSYMMRSNRKPFAISEPLFRSAMDGTGQKVSRRLAVFQEYAGSLRPEHAGLLSIGVAWRNRRVHSLSDNDISADERRCVKAMHAELQRDYAGLSINDLLKRFDASEPPHFKEAAAIIRAAQGAVDVFDDYLLQNLNLEQYIGGMLGKLIENGPLDKSLNRKHGVRQAWGHTTSKKAKVLRLLNMIGVHSTTTITPSSKKRVVSRRVPDALVDCIINMNEEEALSFITQYEIFAQNLEI